MKLFSLRRLIASAAAAITLAATLINTAPAQATSYHAKKYLQVYSMRYLDDARAKAWHLRKNGFEAATVYKSSNGFYAVVAGKLPAHRKDIVEKLKWQGKIPGDSFLTSGRYYVKNMGLHAPKHGHKPAYKSSYGHKPAYKPAHKPAYKPAHKPVYKTYNGQVIYYRH